MHTVTCDSVACDAPRNSLRAYRGTSRGAIQGNYNGEYIALFAEADAVNVDWSQEVGGQGLKAIRRFFRKHQAFDALVVAGAFGIGLAAARSLILGLERAGFVALGDRLDRRTGEQRFLCSELGRRMAKSWPGKRLPGAKADEIIAKLLVRVAEVNSNNALIFYVQTPHVFGSYLSDTPDLGDVDVAYSFAPRAPYKGRATAASIARAEALGKYEGRFFDQLTFGSREVRSALRRVSPRLSLVEFDELEIMGAAHRLLFEETRPL